MMQSENSRSFRDEIWDLMVAIARPAEFTPNCEKELQDILDKGLRKVDFERGTGDSLRSLEAKNNFMLLVVMMKKEAGEESLQLNREHLKETLLKLCPIFPFC